MTWTNSCIQKNEWMIRFDRYPEGKSVFNKLWYNIDGQQISRQTTNIYQHIASRPSYLVVSWQCPMTSENIFHLALKASNAIVVINFEISCLIWMDCLLLQLLVKQCKCRFLFKHLFKLWDGIFTANNVSYRHLTSLFVFLLVFRMRSKSVDRGFLCFPTNLENSIWFLSEKFNEIELYSFHLKNKTAFCAKSFCSLWRQKRK